MNIKKSIKNLAPAFLLNFYHYGLALIGTVVFWFPGNKLIVIGVTGTSGKSTTVDFITKILEENGNSVASLSSIRFKIKAKEWKNELKMTMPGRFMIHKFLREAVNEKCQYAVLEVTSEGIKQYRHKFINFNTVVFTNLSPEHIESHGGFENYRNEKFKLFKATKNIHIINIADDNAQYFWDISAKEKIGFKLKTQNSKLKNTTQDSKIIEADNVEIIKDGLLFKIQDTRFNISLMGEFNIYNTLAAISVGLSQGISLEICKKALEKVRGIFGRMEIVSKNPLIIVDYAHTPEQLEQVYKSLPGKNLVCVFGSCGGGRDKWKRPVLGKIAEQYCKEIIITNEDPYDEDPLEIMEQIASGINNRDYHIVLDRKEAIKKALGLSKDENTVIITGKGSEVWMCVDGGRKIPWSDKEIIKEEILLKNKKYV
ncbi:MAG: UDP-N-acetylmuramyl-tripeptide synthetase [Parcubacteria group bacterium GW2011_GWA2_33_14]|uniref:UDP-N-acetylmuramoyl-L-alanyl-D-glutamate--2, 6-diaminopimelate ligase n=1 Tax=Candidatus Staskawiczbacteria bacterium RIFCSPHIGHO2_02_FULL_33_16 TaxID=1802204 RepID=A0A1G2HWM9_9BACT|nr:MAG: UDP-N-acetylmuramyl-tripeptide synthetase [Parcubacteria group bacterium GW2011_GWA2_33_14]OGZ66932.1 MAG: hypothetical protein A3D34_02090 [Candidatus Staskawiczbacteria bacterium RIFCSPHIGHO2_02_FULL_33_16]OGZ70840.1 MAG: hypothetical protein A2980_02320 [Candidatus Staskawiczbacteria bacterium RIFCSPLOWO2_01_FULL_33_13]